MDVVASALSAAPSLGVGGVLLALVLYLLKVQAGERGEYRTAIADEEKRNAAALEAERDRSRSLQHSLDEERGRRFAAEDRAALEKNRADLAEARLAQWEGR